MPDETGPTGLEAERIVASLRPHGRALFWPSLLLIADAGVVSYFAGSFPEEWQNIAVLCAGGAIAVLFWVLPLFGWLSRRYVITTRRIVLRHGLFVRSRQELLHSRGYDVTVRKNALQSLFRSGNVEINTGLDHPVVLRDIPGADLVQEVLHDLMETNQNLISTRRQQEASKPSDETSAWGSR
jgi:membrane protein YdbS with pleckstrin-like domain